MKIDLTDINTVKKSMAVEVAPEEVAAEADAVVRKIAQQAKIPGFRPGKAPISVVRKRFAKEVEEEVRDRVLSRYYHEATHEKGLHPIGQPVVDEITQEAGEPFRFKTTFEVLPEFELKGHKDVEVQRPSTAVADADIDKALGEIRESRVQLITEEGRKATTGDVILVDVKGTPEEGEPFERERMLIEIGAQDNVPAFNEKLEQAEAGAELKFPVDYPEEFQAKELAGKTVQYEIRVHEVKRRQLPELDDEFAKDMGDFENLAALRDRIGEDLKARKTHEAEGVVRQSLLDKVLTENPIVLPEVLVDDEVRQRLEDLVRNAMSQGMNPEKMDIDWKELREKQVEPARKNVHARLILDAFAREEGLTVEPKEVEERLKRDAVAMKEKVEDLKKKLHEHGGMQMLANQLLREKSLDLLVSVANIQDEE